MRSPPKRIHRGARSAPIGRRARRHLDRSRASRHAASRSRGRDHETRSPPRCRPFDRAHAGAPNHGLPNSRAPTIERHRRAPPERPRPDEQSPPQSAMRTSVCDGRPSGAQQRLLTPATCGSRSGNRCRQQPGQAPRPALRETRRAPVRRARRTRAASRAGPRLSPTRAAPDEPHLEVARRAGHLREGRRRDRRASRSERAAWICVLTKSGRWTATASNNVCHCRLGEEDTLSGGACGCAPVGAPTFWKSESAFGRSTTPSTRTGTGAVGARPITTVSPGATRRFAAVCCATRMPVPAPARSRTCRETWLGSSSGCRARSPGRSSAWNRRSLPVDRSLREADGEHCRAREPDASSTIAACRRPVALRPASRRRQSARHGVVIVAFDPARKAPIEANSATAIATPTAVAPKRPARRVVARNQIMPGTCRREECAVRRSDDRPKPANADRGDSATAASCVLTTSAASVCSAARHEHRDDEISGLMVELSRRFVGEQETRSLHERARDRNSLHLTARELLG